MKYTVCIERPKRRNSIGVGDWMDWRLKRDGYLHWSETALVKNIVEPIYDDGTPDEFGCIYALIEAPLIDYLRDKRELSKLVTIQKGWPEEGTVRRYLVT